MGRIAVSSAWLLGVIFIAFAVGHVASARLTARFYGMETSPIVRWMGATACAAAGFTLLLPDTRLIGATIGVMIMGTGLTTSLLDLRLKPACICMLISIWLTVAVAYGG